jgi:hypothetical protein
MPWMAGVLQQQQQAATGHKKNDTKWRLILFKLFNYNLQFTTLQHYNITIITNHIIIQHHNTMRYFLNFFIFCLLTFDFILLPHTLPRIPRSLTQL